MDTDVDLKAKVQKAGELLRSFIDRDRRRLLAIEELQAQAARRDTKIHQLEAALKEAQDGAGLRDKYNKQRRFISELQVKCAKLEQQISALSSGNM